MHSQRSQRSKNFGLDRNFQSRSKFLISLENFESRCVDFPTKNRAAVGGSLEIFILDRNFHLDRNLEFFFDLWALWVILVRVPFISEQPDNTRDDPLADSPTKTSEENCPLEALRGFSSLGIPTGKPSERSS